MYKILSISILFFFTSPISAQIESPFGFGALSISQGNTMSSFDGHYAILYNQAGLANLDEISFSADAAQLYNNSGLLHFHLAGVIPTKNQGNFGIKIQRYGLDGYNYQNYALSYARPLFKSFRIAATFQLYQFQIEQYGNTFLPNLDFGIMTDLSSKITLGAHLANALPLDITETTAFPTVLSAGIKYDVSKLISLFADVEKNIRQKENIKIGMMYQIHPKFKIRLGINTFPGTFHFGFEVLLDKIHVNIGNAFHQVLGNSTGLGMLYIL
jgi:hypothetical protein